LCLGFRILSFVTTGGDPVDQKFTVPCELGFKCGFAGKIVDLVGIVGDVVELFLRAARRSCRAAWSEKRRRKPYRFAETLHDGFNVFSDHAAHRDDSPIGVRLISRNSL
jgi:hypothetical protein